MIINIYLPNGCPDNKKIIHNNVSPNVSTEWILLDTKGFKSSDYYHIKLSLQ